MKQHLKKLLLGLALVAAAASGAAEPCPHKPVRIVVAAPPGGSIDVVARLVGQRMAEKLGQPVIIENRAGADTLLGIRYVKTQPADGYTLLVTSNSIAGQQAVKLDPGFDLGKDFTGVGAMMRSPWMMLVGSGQPDKTVADFVARGKARPQDMSFASAGVGTSPHMAAENFLQRSGLDLLHVPYKGNGPAIPDVISGRVTMIFDGVSSAAPKVRAGQLRALGVTSVKRISAFPDLPTIAEQGVPNFSSYFYCAVLAPAGTPRDIVEQLASVMKSVTNAREIRDRLEADGAEPFNASPDEFTELLKQEVVQMDKLARELNIKKQ